MAFDLCIKVPSTVVQFLNVVKIGYKVQSVFTAIVLNALCNFKTLNVLTKMLKVVSYPCEINFDNNKSSILGFADVT